MNQTAPTPPTPPTPPKAAADKKGNGKTDAKDSKPKQTRTSMKTLFPDDAKIKVLVEKNPKREGSKTHGRFEGYFKSATVGEALASGLRYDDLAYDVGHKFIEVIPA